MYILLGLASLGNEQWQFAWGQHGAFEFLRMFRVMQAQAHIASVQQQLLTISAGGGSQAHRLHVVVLKRRVAWRCLAAGNLVAMAGSQGAQGRRRDGVSTGWPGVCTAPGTRRGGAIFGLQFRVSRVLASAHHTGNSMKPNCCSASLTRRLHRPRGVATIRRRARSPGFAKGENWA